MFREFASNEKLSAPQVQRLTFSIMLVNLGILTDLLNIALDPLDAKRQINHFYRAFFELLAELEITVRLEELVVSEKELEACLAEGFGKETQTDFFTIADIVYYDRVRDYMDLLAKGRQTRDMMALASRVCEQVVGRKLKDSRDFLAKDVCSPMALSLVLTDHVGPLANRCQDSDGERTRAP